MMNIWRKRLHFSVEASNKDLWSAPRLFAKSAFFSVEINKFSQTEERVHVDLRKSHSSLPWRCAWFKIFFKVWLNLHPFELLVGRKGSSRNTFNQVLLQAAERKKKGRVWIKRVRSLLIVQNVKEWRRMLKHTIQKAINCTLNQELISLPTRTLFPLR